MLDIKVTVLDIIVTVLDINVTGPDEIYCTQMVKNVEIYCSQMAKNAFKLSTMVG